MTRRLIQLALGGMLLGCSGCVVAPYPYASRPPAPPCRTVTQPITVDGKSVPGYGIQCLQPDGSWQLMGALSPTPPVAPPQQPDAGVVYPQPYPYYPYGGYPYAYPWIYGPDIVIGGGWGWGGGGGGGWHGGDGGGGGGGWHGGGGGGGGGWQGGGGPGGGGGGGGGGHGGR